jgi:anti-sigma regulatory factor (Ser/Thr protein kinase)
MGWREFSWKREGVDAAKLEACARGTGGETIEVGREIAGGDFASAGAGASEIKRVIKKLAISPPIVRRVAVASFEAEVNVTVYAREGSISARITPVCIHVVVADRGPGIPDIEQAMQPGWTTATPEVREMGFGAGLGLPNIRENSDYVKIRSKVGEGTVVEFFILLDGA